VPDVRGFDFGSIDVAVLSAYLGRPVTSVAPMGALGPEATSMIGRKLQAELREAGGDDLQPGEIVAGQLARIEAEMRAEGATDEMIAMVRGKISEGHAKHSEDGWDVVFADGKRASVQLFLRGSEADAEYEALEHRWDRENGTDGNRPQEPALLSATVQRSTKGPNETYCLKGRLAARSSTHVAFAISGTVSDQVLNALSAIALKTVETR
jgi:hypothetical protein